MKTNAEIAAQLESALAQLDALRPTRPAQTREEMARRFADDAARRAMRAAMYQLRGERDPDEVAADEVFARAALD